MNGVMQAALEEALDELGVKALPPIETPARSATRTTGAVSARTGATSQCTTTSAARKRGTVAISPYIPPGAAAGSPSSAAGEDAATLRTKKPAPKRRCAGGGPATAHGRGKPGKLPDLPELQENVDSGNARGGGAPQRTSGTRVQPRRAGRTQKQMLDAPHLPSSSDDDSSSEDDFATAVTGAGSQETAPSRLKGSAGLDASRGSKGSARHVDRANEVMQRIVNMHVDDADAAKPGVGPSTDVDPETVLRARSQEVRK